MDIEPWLCSHGDDDNGDQHGLGGGWNEISILFCQALKEQGKTDDETHLITSSLCHALFDSIMSRFYANELVSVCGMGGDEVHECSKGISSHLVLVLYIASSFVAMVSFMAVLGCALGGSPCSHTPL